MKISAFLVAAMMVLPSATQAQKEPTQTPKAPREPVEEVPLPRRSASIDGRIAIGDPAPGFILESAAGGQVRLSKLRGDWLLMVFADRGSQLRDLRSIHDDMKSLGARVVGVCHEKAGRLKSIAARDTLKFLLLADVTGEISAMYGLYDRDRSETQPGFLVIDRRGVVRTALLGQQLPADQVAQIARAKITGLW